MDVVECFSQRFVKSGMRMYGRHHAIDRRFRFHGRHGFRDQFKCFRADDVNTENFPEALIGNNLYKALMRTEDRCLTISCEGELAHFHFETLSTSLRFGNTHTADSGIRVSCSRNAIAVNGPDRLACDVPYRDHSLSRRNVSKLRRARDHIADCVNIWLALSLVRIHLHETAIQLNFRVLNADILRVRLAADSYEQLFELKLFLLTIGKRCT